MMYSKVLVLVSFVAAAAAGALPAPAGVTYTYSGGPAPALQYAQPLQYAAAAPAAIKYTQSPSYHQYSSPVYQQPSYYNTLAAAAPVAYAQPVGAALKVAQPAYYAQQQPIVKAVAPALVAKTVVRDEPYDPNPHYSYSYSVSDSLTGDSKSASETREGDVVKGQYSLVEPDGAIRTVTYTADPINGFNAVVDRSAPTVVKTVQPALVKSVAPIYAQHAPVVKAVAPAVYAQPQYFAQPASVVKAVAPTPHYAQHAPIYAQHAPIYAQQAPIYAQHSPIYAQQAPIYASQPVYQSYAAQPVVKAVAPQSALVKSHAHPGAVYSTSFSAPKYTYSY